MEINVYIVRCADGSYYVGLTKKPVEGRVSEHNAGLVKTSYTYSRRPVVLVYNEPYESIVQAIARERQLKGWSRRKKEALIGFRYDALPDLASRPKRAR